MDPFAEFIKHRGPQVGWNAVVVHRALCALDFGGSYQQVQRFIKPCERSAAGHRGLPCVSRPSLKSRAG